jgi:hypothetical protein
VVIIRLTVLTYYVWIAVIGESGRSYLKAWLEALGEDRARRLPTRSPTSADPSTRRSSTSSRLGGTCDKKAKLCSIPLEDKQAVLLPLREFMLARVQLPLHGGAYRYHLGRGTPAAHLRTAVATPDDASSHHEWRHAQVIDCTHGGRDPLPAAASTLTGLPDRTKSAP